ncbi:unnamed protein product [Cylicocyclus nassatus]|uniref:Uncharacterized protein n=1 Tax=Cylicocyclus nassatus TaxID=53992 RepID=A0AA36GQX0_CYLNA|nr:unnamed protein product [Cylicocyclus nassatus]
MAKKVYLYGNTILTPQQGKGPWHHEAGNEDQRTEAEGCADLLRVGDGNEPIRRAEQSETLSIGVNTQ